MDSFVAFLGVDVVIQLVLVPISAAILFGCTRLFKFKDQSYVSALKVVAIAAFLALVVDAVSLFLLASAGLVLAAFASLFMFAAFFAALLLLIKFFYNEDWKNTVFAWLVFSVVDFVVSFAVGFVVGAVLGLFLALPAYGSL